MNQLGFLRRLLVVATTLVCAGAGAGACKKAAPAASADAGMDGAADGDAGPVAVQCLPVAGAGAGAGTDEFGHNAPELKMPSSLGRVNIFEVTAPTQLDRVDVYLRSGLPQTRLTIAIQEAPTRTAAFAKLGDVQIDVEVCEGWASSGPLAIPLKVGRFYAMGFDPNQAVTPFVSTDGDSLPIDGLFGRLIGSRVANSVSVPSLTWDKFLDKEYNRQRIVTSPRAPDPAPVPDAGTTDGGAADQPGDGGPSDANRDGPG